MGKIIKITTFVPWVSAYVSIHNR